MSSPSLKEVRKGTPTVFGRAKRLRNASVMNATEDKKRSTKRSIHGGREIRLLDLQLGSKE